MFGASGSGVFGMGVVLGFANKGSAGMRNATREFLQLSASAQKADLAAKSMVSGYKTAGKMMLVGGGMVAAGYAISHFGAESQQAEADVRSLGLSAEKTKQLISGLEDILYKKKVRIPYRDAEKSLYDLISAGISAGNEFQKPTNALLTLEKAGVLTLGTIGDIKSAMALTGQVYERFFPTMTGSFEDKITRYTDAVAGGVKSARTTLATLGPEIAQVMGDIPASWSFEDAVGLIATMIGQYEERTDSAFRSLVASLPDVKEKLGINVYDNMGMPLAPLKIIDNFYKKFGESIDENEQKLLISVFGKERAGLIQNLISLRNRHIEIDESVTKSGTAMEMFKTRTNTANYATVGMVNSLIGLGNKISDNASEYQFLVSEIENSTIALNYFLKEHEKARKALSVLVTGGLIATGAAVLVGGMGWVLRTLIKYPKETFKALSKMMGNINWSKLFKPQVANWANPFGPAAFKSVFTFSALKKSIMSNLKKVFDFKSIGALFTNLGRNAGSLFVSGFKATFVGEIAYLLLVKFPEMLSELRMKWMGLETVDPNRKDIGVGAQNISAKPDDSALSKFSLSYWYDKWAYNAKSVTPMKSSVDLLHKPSMPTGLGFKSNAKEKASFLSDFYKTAWRELTGKGEKKPTIADTSVPSITAQIVTPVKTGTQNNITNEVNIKPTIHIDGGDESKVKAQVLAAMNEFKRDAQLSVMRYGKTPATAGAW